MIASYAFFIGIALLWFLAFAMIPEVVTVFGQNNAYVRRKEDYIIGAVGLAYVAFTLIGGSLYYQHLL